jgi:hypothetical protein
VDPSYSGFTDYFRNRSAARIVYIPNSRAAIRSSLIDAAKSGKVQHALFYANPEALTKVFNILSDLNYQM